MPASRHPRCRPVRSKIRKPAVSVGSRCWSATKQAAAVVRIAERRDREIAPLACTGRHGHSGPYVRQRTDARRQGREHPCQPWGDSVVFSAARGGEGFALRDEEIFLEIKPNIGCFNCWSGTTGRAGGGAVVLGFQ